MAGCQTAAPPSLSPPVDEEPSEIKLTVAEHLEELRRRLGISLAAVVIAIGVSLTQVERLIGWLMRPAQPLLPRLAFFSPTEPLLAYLQVATFAGLMLAMPVLLAQLWGFARTGLKRQERSWGLTFIWSGSGLFIGGVAFAYFALLPLSLTFLLGLARGTLEPVISLQRYLSFVMGLTFWCGVMFQLPAVLWILVRVGIVTPAWLRQQRPYAVLVLVIIAAVLTPTTDVATLLLVTVPLLLLYEVSILLTRLAMRRTPRLPS